MNFPDVCTRLLQDKAIRRASWQRGEEIWADADVKHHPDRGPHIVIRFLKRTNTKPHTWETEEWSPEKEDLTATDWRTTTY